MTWDMKSLDVVLKEGTESPKGRLAITTHLLHTNIGVDNFLSKGPELPAGTIVMIMDVITDKLRWGTRKLVKVFWNEQNLVVISPEKLFLMSPENKFDNLAFAITGTLSKQREFYKALIKFKGGIWKNAVSRQTDILVIGRTKRLAKSTKYKKAVRLGIKIVSEDELRQLLYQ